jgi:hypothetical protein
VVATAGGMQAAWACNRTAQLTAQLGNVLEAAVGTMVCDETGSKKDVHKRSRREARICLNDAIVDANACPARSRSENFQTPVHNSTRYVSLMPTRP